MITSHRQLNATKKQIQMLKESIQVLKKKKSVLAKSSLIQSESKIKELTREVSRYEELYYGGIDTIRIENPEDIMLLPLMYRIAKQLTQEAFANEVGVPLRMIARYEASNYSNINGETLKNILNKLPLKIKGSVKSVA